MKDICSNTTVTVGTANTIVSYDKERIAFSLRNTSTGGQVITVKIGTEGDTVANTGIVLNPNEIVTDSNSEGYPCWAGLIQAVSSAAGGTLAIFERILV